jgi:putative membrane protein
MQLTDNDRTRIVAAIREAETRTAGEIYCVIARASSGYRLVPLAWAALIALAVPWPLIYLTLWPASVIFFIQLAAFLVAVIGLSSRGLRMLIVPPRAKRDRAHGEAVRQFLSHGLHQTESRTGVLIFVSVAERYAEVVADAGIDQKVESGTWDEAVAVLIKGIREERPADGFVAAIEKCTAVLAQHFPAGPNNRDELPNLVIEM